MNGELLILIAEAVGVYLLVLGTHALRRRFGLAYFYALLGGITAIMSWVTDAGVTVNAGSVTFMVGSSVFYTSLLLGVFVIYVFDGPHAARIAISTVAGVSILVPVIASILHLQMHLTGQTGLGYVPVPSLRVNTASVVATVMDLVFLGVVWEFLGKPNPPLSIGIRAFVTLLGVMWLDVLLFGTGAFFGNPEYLNIVKGTFLSRLVIATFAWPFLYAYLSWEGTRSDSAMENRPVLAILKEVAKVRGELSVAQREIERREEAERRQRFLESELRQAHKLASLGTLAGGVAHEINNPLMGVINYAELIRERTTADDSIREFAAEIGREGERIAGIVGTLLRFAEQGESEFTPAHLHDIVDACLLLVRTAFERDSIAIEVDVPRGLPAFNSHRGQLEQVLLNLLSNARDALNVRYPGGGDAEKRVLITGSVASRSEVVAERERPCGDLMREGSPDGLAVGALLISDGCTIAGGTSGKWIVLTVEDHGTGMKRETMERIFDPFFTTKDRALFAGLGLSTSLGIVHAHGGILTVESEAGKWTRFRMSLPVGARGPGRGQR